jgi:rhamnosyltransferase
MSAVVAVVVLYHPPPALAEMIRSVRGITQNVLLIDNTEQPFFDLESLRRQAPDFSFSLVQNGENKGIAWALNEAGKYGLLHGFQWLLTLDQDSRFDPDTAPALLAYALAAGPEVAIVAPYHVTPGAAVPALAQEAEVIRHTMTSGNLLRLSAFQTCGPFEEKLFIDSVDHEYCLRLRRHGFRIIRLNGVRLSHPQGNITYTRFLFFRWKTTNHGPARRYYMARNRWYVMTRYFFFDPKFFRRELSQYIRDYFRVLFLENQKRKKISAMIKGTWHFLLGRYGPV